MHYLKNKRVYLGGPIQHSDNTDWRTYPKKRLVEEFGVDLFDPFSDPKQQWLPTLRQAQKDKDFETIIRISKSFVRKDLAAVDRSDFLVSYLPDRIPTTGTHHEIINSNNAKKPTLLVTNKDCISYIPLWYFGFIPIEFMFAGWDNLFAYLQAVDRGEHRDNMRWSFVYGDI